MSFNKNNNNLIKDYVSLISEMFFPNIHLETSLVDFGCILNNTEVQQRIKMTNFGPLIVNYRWKFLLDKNNIQPFSEQPLKITEKAESSQLIENKKFDDEINATHYSELFIEYPDFEASNNPEKSDDGGLSETKRTNNANNALQEVILNKTVGLELPSVEEIFDISPLYGSLDPGQCQELTITFYGHKDIKAFVRAICQVKNGPDYEMLIRGEASVLNYELSSKIIDFGCIVHFFVY